MSKLTFDHERLAVDRLSIDYVAFSYRIAKTLTDSDGHGESDLQRIVSMLTRLIQRTQTVAEDSIEYEYRDAEYEYAYENP